MKPPIVLNDEVREALEASRAVVALESTVISHGLPYPENLKTALSMEQAIRQHGATPASVAVIGGSIRAGLSISELERLATGQAIRKVSRRDLPIVLARAEDGATTVAATATIAAWAGIPVFATGGIGGVHRTMPGTPLDVSNDLPTLASVPIVVVCAGAKAILDLKATLEWLETAGVPVLGYGCDEFPAFYSRQSGLPVDARVDSPQQVAAIFRASRQLDLPAGLLVTVPIPADFELPAPDVELAIEHALAEASRRKLTGKALTPFFLNHVAERTAGDSLRANIALLRNNSAVAAQIAVALLGAAAGPSRPDRT